MEITFCFKTSEAVGMPFRKHLVEAYSAQLLELIRKNPPSKEKLQEIEQAGGLKVFVFHAGDSTSNEIYFKHFTQPVLFETQNHELPDICYPIVVRGNYSNDTMTLEPIGTHCSGQSRFSERFDHLPESDFKIRYIVEINNKREVKLLENLSQNPTSHLHPNLFHSELLNKVKQFAPPSACITKTSAMCAFESAIDKEVTRLIAKGCNTKAKHLKQAKERVLQAAQNDEHLANSCFALYSKKVNDLQSVEDAARISTLTVGHSISLSFQKTVATTANMFFNSANSFSFEELAKRKKQMKHEEKERKLKNIREREKTVTDTETNILYALRKAEDRNTQCLLRRS